MIYKKFMIKRIKRIKHKLCPRGAKTPSGLKYTQSHLKYILIMKLLKIKQTITSSRKNTLTVTDKTNKQTA